MFCCSFRTFHPVEELLLPKLKQNSTTTGEKLELRPLLVSKGLASRLYYLQVDVGHFFANSCNEKTKKMFVAE
jgi:hypothetical protein